jgi:hypothetical protein
MLALQIPPTESENDDDTINRVRQPSTMARQHEIGIMRCIHSIQLAFAGRYEEYSKSSNSETTGPPIDIGLSSIDSSPVGYHFLARQWARQSVLAHAARKRLQFNLPETLEGTQCAISFDMSYEVLPFPVNGPRATSILNDLDVLSNSSVEVVQTVPLSSIDASLLFGLPITVKNGLENGFDQYQTMEVLVYSLLRNLQERELALLLQTAPQHGHTKSASQSLFGSAGSQMFLLMAKELPKSLSQQPQCGILFRYAEAIHLIGEASSTTQISLIDPDTESQLVDYVDQALDCLECSTPNPQYMEHVVPSSDKQSRLREMTTSLATNMHA